MKKKDQKSHLLTFAIITLSAQIIPGTSKKLSNKGKAEMWV